MPNEFGSIFLNCSRSSTKMHPSTHVLSPTFMHSDAMHQHAVAFTKPKICISLLLLKQQGQPQISYGQQLINCKRQFLYNGLPETLSLLE